jgi:transposase
MLNLSGLKSRNMISIPLDIPKVETHGVQVNSEGDYIITVTSTIIGTICQHCGRKITKSHGHGRDIDLRHTPIFGHRVYLRLLPKRYKCPDCDNRTTTQKLDWCESKSPHTKAYDEHLMKQLVNSTVEDVSHKENVGYDAVDGVINRCIDASVNWDEYTELKILGIDEIARRKGRKDYIAMITTQQANGRVAILGVLADRKKESVRQFLESIPKRLRGTMETVCTDMWDGYVNAVEEFAAAHDEATIQVVIDRFHVAKNYRKDVDTVRKQEFRRLKQELSETAYQEIVKGMMWILRKNNKDLTPEKREKLNRLFELSPTLKAAYAFREKLTAIFEMQLTKEEGKKRLREWRDEVRRSGLTCFNKFLKTLDNWLDKIANYFTNRLSSGFVEGLNNKIKVMKRRSYGILRIETWFQRLYLDLEGYRRFA